LTLPNNDQLEDGSGQPRNLLVANGGEVRLLGTHTYTGKTEIMRGTGTTLQIDAAEVEPNEDLAGDPILDPPTRLNTTLTVMTLANGGQPSSVGSSSSDASNLVVQGGTLKYVGGAATTDRLFTVGTRGGTIDASGTGAVTFSSTAALDIDVAEARTGYLVGGIGGSFNNEVLGVPGISVSGAPGGLPIPLDTSDLVPGMSIYDSDNLIGVPKLVDDDSVLEVTNVGLNYLFVGETDLDEDNESPDEGPAPWGGYPSLTDVATFNFGPAPARSLTLTGSNTENNTLSALIGNAADVATKPAPLPEEPVPTPAEKAQYQRQLDEYNEGYGTVGIRKTGLGKWILNSNNTYSGETNVEAGTLVINGDQSGNGVTTVSADATLGGGGTLPGALINRGTVAPGETTTGTLTVQGNYRQTSGATLAVQIGGTAAGAFDALHVLEGIDTGPIEGDYNEDGAVNAADYTVWRDHLGETFNLPNEGEDVETMGVVDQEDYDLWKENFGEENLSLGLAQITGAIDIDLISGFTPAAGNMFTIVEALEGLTASNITLTGDSSGFNLLVNATSLVLHYTGAGAGAIAGTVPEPSSLVLLSSVLVGMTVVRRGRRA
jgi:autotransporter-associated beta strand protein